MRQVGAVDAAGAVRAVVTPGQIVREHAVGAGAHVGARDAAHARLLCLVSALQLAQLAQELCAIHGGGTVAQNLWLRQRVAVSRCRKVNRPPWQMSDATTSGSISACPPRCG